MKARLSAVQHALFLLLVTSLVFGFVARPHPANRRYMAALDEMSTFRDGFKQAELEKSLLDYARAQGVVSLATIQQATRGRDVPPLSVAKDAPSLQPSAAVTLRTLDDVRLRARPDSSLTIGLVHADAIGAALAWRLARAAEAGPGPWTLTNIELVPAKVEAADVELEPQVAQLRLARIGAQRAVNDASKKLDVAEQIFETRRKWKLPWKQLVKSDEARKAARATLEEAQVTLSAADQKYEASVKRAEASRPASPPSAAFAIARVSLDHGTSHQHFDIPVAIEQRPVAVPSLRGGNFDATHEAGLWDEVKDLDADAAVAAIRTHFNWHYRYVELMGIRFGGMTVLQFLPCLLPLLQILLMLRTRAVGAGYNPFGTTIDSALPRVGFRSRFLDALAIVLLPVAAAASAASSLLLIGQVPVLPVLTAIVCLILGVYALSKLGDLQSLVEAMEHSHSSHPPAKPAEKKLET